MQGSGLWAVAAMWLAAAGGGLAAETNAWDGPVLDRAAVLAAAQRVTPEAYPNADDVLLDDWVRDVYNADGTSVTWDETYLKVLTEKGRRSAQSQSLSYTLPYGTAAYRLCEVIKPDGTAVAVDLTTQSRTTVDSSQMAMNIYNPNDKVVQLTLPDVAVGDIIHYRTWRETVKPRVPNTWSEYQVFEYTSPYRHYLYEVLAPPELPLSKIALRAEVPGTVRHTTGRVGDRLLYRWEVTDVPRMYAEPDMPVAYTVVQRLLVSTIPTWEDISRWYWKLSLPHLETVTPAMRAKVAELTQGATSRLDRITRIFTFVSQQVRYMGITTETEAPGYEPHDVKTTFENRYGVCRDKAALLAALLRVADVPAYPCLIHAGPRKDEDVPQPYFNHAICAAEDGQGGYILMDPTDEQTAELCPAYLGNKSYLVARPEGEKLRTSAVQPATANLMHIASTGRLSPDGTLAVRSVLRFDGINDNMYRGYFARLKPEERRRFFEGAIKSCVAGASLTALDVQPADMQDTRQPLAVTLDYRAPDYLVKGPRYTLLEPPWVGGTLGSFRFVLGNNTGLAQRKYPLVTETTCGVAEQFTLELGEGVGPLAACPTYAALQTNHITFQQTMTCVSNRLSGSSRLLMDAVEFTPAEYLVLKRQLRDIEYENRKRPLFQTPGASAAPAADRAEDNMDVLVDETDVTLVDARQWTAVRHVRQKVLTYAGKKACAELKIGFNPAWEDARLRQATVTLPDGTVRNVVAQEMNLMDEPWVGEAPRYPAARTLVISLPGVEVGSVVDYTVETRRHGQPFFALAKPFGGFEPTRGVRLAIVAPERLRLNVLDLTGGAAPFRQSVTNGCVRYEWTSPAQPSIVREDALPPVWSFTPTVFVSAGDWKSYAAAVRQALLDAADGQRATRELARRITDGVRGPAALTTAVRDWVARQIRAAGPGLDALPLTAVTAADRTLKEGYGNVTDRAVVLYAMLKAVGLKPEFVLAADGGPQVEALRRPYANCPQRGFFNSVLVRVGVDGQPVYLNDTDQYAPLGAVAHDGCPGLTLDGKLCEIAAAETFQERESVLYQITVDAGGDATVTATRFYRGTDFAAFRRYFAELPPEERRRHYQELVAGLAQSAEAVGDLVTDYTVHPGRKAFTARIPRFAVRTGNYLYFSVPEGLGNLLRLRADTRTNPWYLGGPQREEAAYAITLPDNTESVCLAPEPFTWEGPSSLGSVQVRSAAAKGDQGRQVLDIVETANLAPALVAAPEYRQLLDLNRRLTHPGMQTIMVKLKP